MIDNSWYDTFYPNVRTGWTIYSKTHPNHTHSMQPQQFAVNAIWTQVLPPSPRGTFLPCLRSPSSVLVNRVSLASSTAAAVASLCCPSGGDATDSTQKTTKSETNTNSARRKQTKYKLLRSKTEARLRTRSPPNTNKTYFTRDSWEKTKCVIYGV